MSQFFLFDDYVLCFTSLFILPFPLLVHEKHISQLVFVKGRFPLFSFAE